MRRRLVLVTAAGTVLAAGLLAVPALAATTPDGRAAPAACPMGGPLGGFGPGGPTGPTGPTGSTGPQTRGNGPWAGMGMGQGRGMGMGQGRGMGYGMGMGGTSADPLAGLAKGSLDDTQKRSLAAVAEEEKLAHDVYTALAGKVGDPRFTRIGAAETRHLAAARALMTRYGVTDPTAGRADGAFATAAVQQRYADLVARGSSSLDAALAVGRDVENADVAQLAKARAGVTAPDVLAVYDRLTMASQMHLRAFGFTG